MKTLDEKEVTLEREYGCTDRIGRMRNRIASVTPYVSSQRALIVTQAYQEFESEPICIKRAKTLKRILENLHVWIADDELIVGQMAEHLRSAQVFPEMGIFWLEEEMDEFETRAQDKFIVPDSVKKDLKGIFEYWHGKTLYDHMLKRAPEEALRLNYMPHSVLNGRYHLYNGLGHIAQDFAKVLRIGFSGIKKEAQDVLNNMDLAQPGANKKRLFLESVMISCDAAVLFANRYADEALRMADQEKDPKRKKELLCISEICRKVPEHPAETFWEALQAIWFVQLITQIETEGVSISPGRLDQYVYPYYLYSRDNGMDGNLQEVLEAFWLKFTEMVKLYDKHTAATNASFPMGQNMVAGGVNKYGQDVTNELSYMMLDAQLHLRMPQPNFGVRVHSATPSKFLRAVAQTIRDANTMPQLDNDEVYIPSLMERGVPLEMAREYSIEGCNEPGLPGKLHGRGFGGFINQTKCLELALNDGKCMITGQQMGPQTGEMTETTSFEDIMEAYTKQVQYFVHQNAILQNVADAGHAELMPVPFLSSTMDVIQTAKDITDGGCEFNFTGPNVVGIGTTGNSLAAIKQVVYEKQTVTLPELLKAMKENFKGYEELRKELLAVPKWCNDEDYVDKLTSDALNVVADALRTIKNERGGPYLLSCIPMSSVLPMGKDVGATADGRLAYTSLSDSVGSQPGTDLEGPTAAIKSVGKLNNIEMGNGLIFNMRIDPYAIQNERIAAFEGLIRTFVRMKCMQIQFNIVSSKVLRKAQDQPDKYRGLAVRVTGYSAFFVDLSHEVQEEIIKRNEHAFS